jgi:CheY-like chemotaxis protein/HPt (histidine-containing phosphotransfer) domain-containing protein
MMHSAVAIGRVKGRVAAHAGRRVLIVDDDDLSAAVLAQLLRLTGFEAETETDARRAVERALAEPFDLLMIDLSMPEIDGFEVLRRLRQGEAAQRRGIVPAIAVTGLVGADDRARCLAAGFAGHLHKPVQMARLQAAIEHTLGTQTVIGGDVIGGKTASDVERLRAAAARLQRLTADKDSFAPTAAEAFALRSAQLIDALRLAIDMRDEDAAIQHAQALDESARFLGARRLAACAAAVGTYCAAGDWPQARQELREFEHQHQAVLTVLLQIDR